MTCPLLPHTCQFGFSGIGFGFRRLGVGMCEQRVDVVTEAGTEGFGCALDRRCWTNAAAQGQLRIGKQSSGKTLAPFATPASSRAICKSGLCSTAKATSSSIPIGVDVSVVWIATGACSPRCCTNVPGKCAVAVKRQGAIVRLHSDSKRHPRIPKIRQNRGSIFIEVKVE